MHILQKRKLKRVAIHPLFFLLIFIASKKVRITLIDMIPTKYSSEYNEIISLLYYLEFIKSKRLNQLIVGSVEI